MCELDDPGAGGGQRVIKTASRPIQWSIWEGGKQNMAYDNDRPAAGMAHRVVLEEREQLTISGVEEVESFDESAIILTTAQGGLEVQGEGLHIEKLSLDGGDLKVEGLINALVYEPQGRGRGGLLSRLLGG